MHTDREKTQEAFWRLKPEIDRSYPHGWCVALEGERIIADAPTFEKLAEVVTAMGRKPADTFAVEAGVDYPKTAIILSLR